MMMIMNDEEKGRLVIDACAPEAELREPCSRCRQTYIDFGSSTCTSAHWACNHRYGRTTMAHMQNPVPFLTDLVEKDVIVKLTWGMEYKGKLLSCDSYMNLQLGGTEELVGGESTGVLGEVLVRCNNVLYVRASSDNA